MFRDRTSVLSVVLAAILAAAWPCPGHSEPPLVVFDVPFTVECRDATPQARPAGYSRKIIEAVVKISAQLYSGDEEDLKRLHYEISTGQQMPVVSFLPSTEVTSDVAGGTIAIQAAEHHGNLSFKYLILPGAGNGELRGDLTSSRVQYGLLAPKQVLVASGTIERGCGVYFDLRTSTQDTLQRQREFACLFDVPRSWRADYVTVRCKARGMKRGFAGVTASEADCGTGLLCVGLHMSGDDEARAYAEDLAKKQQFYFRRLAATAQEARAQSAGNALAAVASLFIAGASRSGAPALKVGAAVEASLDGQENLREQLTGEARDAGKELDAAKQGLRKMNGQ